MTIIADKIFYCYSKNNNVSEIITQLDKYMLHHDTNESEIIIIPNERKSEQQKSTQTTPIHKDKDIAIDTPVYNNTVSYITPKQRDSLFWSLYICQYGYADYTTITFNEGSRKLDIHQNMVNYLKKNPYLWKQTNQKITKIAIEEICSDLLTNQKKSLLSNILAYACFFQKNILIVHVKQKSYWDIVNENATDTIVLRLDLDNCFHAEINCSNQDICELKKNRIGLESYDRPLRPMSFYKVPQLQTIASLLNIDINIKKADLYDAILRNVKW